MAAELIEAADDELVRPEARGEARLVRGPVGVPEHRHGDAQAGGGQEQDDTERPGGEAAGLSRAPREEQEDGQEGQGSEGRLDAEDGDGGHRGRDGREDGKATRPRLQGQPQGEEDAERAAAVDDHVHRREPGAVGRGPDDRQGPGEKGERPRPGKQAADHEEDQHAACPDPQRVEQEEADEPVGEERPAGKRPERG